MISSKIEIIVKYRTNITKFKASPVYSYRIIEACCKSFKVACEEEYIGVDDDLYSEVHFRFAISKVINYPGESYNSYSHEISFCPFCGKKITFEVKETISEIAKKIGNYNKRKTHFLKGLNKILLLIRFLSKYDTNPTEKEFIYKYGMNQFKWKNESKIKSYTYGWSHRDS